MVERLRALFEAPLDPAVARAVVVLACAVTVGFTIVVGLGGIKGGRVPTAADSIEDRAGSSQAIASRPHKSTAQHRLEPRQDPQDRPGSAAARRAHRELASHRALQHVPYRRGGVEITLVGARSGRAVLRVEAPSAGSARRGWQAFLRRYWDEGRAYLPMFTVKGARRG